MNKIFTILLLTSAINLALYSQETGQYCPGIPIICQFKMNQWAQYDLLPKLSDFNVMLREKLSKLPTLRQRMSDRKFIIIHCLSGNNTSD